MIIADFFKKFKETSFMHVSTLVSGNVVAQVISLLLYPLVTRIYSPEDFGLFGAYLSIVVITSALFTLQFNVGIPIPNKDTDAINLRILSFLSSFGFTLIVFLLVISLKLTFTASKIITISFQLPISILFQFIYFLLV